MTNKCHILTYPLMMMWLLLPHLKFIGGGIGMRMMRWAYGVTLYDRLRSENIRVAIGVAPLSGKIREARLRWYGHVRRADSCSVAAIAFNLRIPGPKPVGRPKTRWTDAVRRDLRTLGLAPDTDLFRDRPLWRRTIHYADPCFVAGTNA